MFIYCNSCFETKSENFQKFFVTSCSHVFCKLCLSSNKNVCRLCNQQCRILEINKDMPPDVKIMFDPDSVQKMVGNIKKIRSLQENQAKLYIEKMKPKMEQYPKSKQYIQKLYGLKKTYIEAIKKEKQIIERLKHAYKTNQITPDLFTLSGDPREVGQNTKQNTTPTQKGTVGLVSSPRSGLSSNDRSGHTSLSHQSSTPSSTSHISRASMMNFNALRQPLTPMNPANGRLNVAPASNSTPSRSQVPLLSSLMPKHNLSRLSVQPKTPSSFKAPSSASSFSPASSSRYHPYTSSTDSRVNNQSENHSSPIHHPQKDSPQFRSNQGSNLIPKSRGNLLEYTLRQLNAESQKKYQTLRQQQQHKF